jgi:hypothetical protein
LYFFFGGKYMGCSVLSPRVIEKTMIGELVRGIVDARLVDVFADTTMSAVMSGCWSMTFV